MKPLRGVNPTSIFNQKSTEIHKAKKTPLKNVSIARHQWLTPAILATQEAEIRTIMV
jgi:hypothetical protein